MKFIKILIVVVMVSFTLNFADAAPTTLSARPSAFWQIKPPPPPPRPPGPHFARRRHPYHHHYRHYRRHTNVHIHLPPPPPRPPRP